MSLSPGLVVVALLCSLCSAACCKRGEAVPPRRDKPGTVAKEHRPAASVCDRSPVNGSASSGSGECSRDTDCKAGRNGRCNMGLGFPPTGNRCEYDECYADGECAKGGPCQCGDPALFAQPHRCTAGNCRVDADCGPHGYCSPSKRAIGAETAAGWYCHTDADECTNDSECKEDRSAYCGYSTARERWVCDRQRATP